MFTKKRNTYRRKRKFYKKKAYGRKCPTKKIVRQMIKNEKPVKHTYLEGTYQPSTTSYFVDPVNYPAQGVAAYNTDESESTQGQRIGNYIDIRSLIINWTAQVSTSNTNGSMLRLTLFQWLVPIDTSSEVPSVGDIYAISSSSYQYMTPFNYDNRSKYKIIIDKRYHLNLASNTSYITRQWKIPAKNFKCKRLKFIGDAQAGTSASCIKGNIFIIITSDDSSGLYQPTWTFTSRLTYTD